MAETRHPALYVATIAASNSGITLFPRFKSYLFLAKEQ
jgi:hypothetical protein